MIIAAAAALALVACAKVETFQNTNEENAVSFGVYAGKMTTKVTGLTTSNIANFGVYSSYTTADWTTSDKMNFMFDQQVTGSAHSWTYSPVKYWPNETTDKLSFWAYAPYKDANNGITENTANSTAGYPKITYTMPADNYQVDLLWATPVMNKVNNSAYTDGTANPTAGDATTTNKVQFSFKHALSLIDVQARYLVDLANSPSGTTGDALPAASVVKINSITLSGSFPVSGVLNLNDGTWSDQGDNADKSWTRNFGTPKNVTNANASIIANDEQIMVIPKASGATTITLQVNYDVITTDAALQGGSITVNNVLSSTGELTILGGKKYAIIAVLGLTSVKLDVQEIGDWGDVQASDEINLPLND